MSGSEKPGHGWAIEALPEETGSQRIGPTYRHGARVRLYRRQMVPRISNLALVSGLLLGVGCAKERTASSETPGADTAAAPARPTRDTTSVAGPAQGGDCGPKPLQCADRIYVAFFQGTAARLVPGYRLPDERDLGDLWSAFDSFVYKTTDDTDSTKAPYWTKGDFNNDGTIDFAYILIRDTDRSKSLFAFVSTGERYTPLLLREGFDEEMGLATQGPGTFTTAAGKGYGRPTPGEPTTVTVEKHAIAFFMFEGAASLFVWDTSTGRFVRVWMSD